MAARHAARCRLNATTSRLLLLSNPGRLLNSWSEHDDVYRDRDESPADAGTRAHPPAPLVHVRVDATSPTCVASPHRERSLSHPAPGPSSPDLAPTAERDLNPLDPLSALSLGPSPRPADITGQPSSDSTSRPSALLLPREPPKPRPSRHPVHGVRVGLSDGRAFGRG